MRSISQSYIARFGGAILIVFLALIATLLVESIAVQTPFTLFFVGVAATAWFLGRGPGLLAEILYAASAQLVLTPYLISIGAEPPRIFQLISFLLFGTALVWGLSSFKKRFDEVPGTEITFQGSFEGNPFPSWTIESATGRFVGVNKAATDAYGYSREEFASITISDLLSDDVVTHAGDGSSPGRSGPISVVKHRRKDGSSFYVELIQQETPEQADKYRLYHAIDVTDRIRTSDALKTTEARLAQVFGTCPVAMAVTCWADRSFIDVNPEFCEMTGWELAELRGKTATEIGLLDAELEQGLAKVLEHQNTISDREIQIRTRAGKIRNVIVGAVFAEMNGEQIIVSSLVDVTELRRAEKRNSAAERRLRLVTEKARVGLVMINERRRFSFVNNEYAEMFGLPTSDIAGKRVAEVHPDLYTNQIEPYLDKVFDGHSLNFEVRQSTRSGNRFFDIRCEPTIVNGEVSSVVAVVMDITQKTLADLARDASEERYRTLFEYSPDGIAIADTDSRYIDVNEALCKMLGYSREELIGKHATDIFVPREVPHLGEVLYGLNADLEYYQEWQYRRKDGSTFPGEVIATIMPDGNTLTVIRDITERKHLEDQLLQAQKMEAIGVLAGGVAHDFNNILTAISGYSDLTLQNMRSDDPLREYISEIRQAGDRAATLTKQLLSFSRRGEMSLAVHNLNDSINDTQRMLRRIIKENVAFRIELMPDLHNVKVDASHISQVLVNLVVNAGDAMPEGGTITISTRNTYLDGDIVQENVVVTSGPYVELTVRDTGVGMDENTKRRIFEPFYTTKEAGKGTGLGLSTVYGIVRQSGGDISVESEPGKGSTFRVFLPAANTEKDERRSTYRSQETPKRTGSILLVEDESPVRTLVHSILTRQGFTVVPAESGEKALDICRTGDGTFDLLLTDMIMPGMDGITLQSKICEIRPGMRTLIMSGYTGETLEKAMLLEPNISFIGKPFGPEELIKSVVAIIDPNPELAETNPAYSRAASHRTVT
jgi:two-component system, cell cycle sensor histidine kinase and response regulator CckA